MTSEPQRITCPVDAGCEWVATVPADMKNYSAGGAAPATERQVADLTAHLVRRHVAQYHSAPTPVRRQDGDATESGGPHLCVTVCDPDCDTGCHEHHQVPYKRTHDPDTCPGEAVAVLRELVRAWDQWNGNPRLARALIPAVTRARRFLSAAPETR